MTPWTQFVTKVYKDGKSKNTNYSLKDAMKRASKDYKKSKRLGGNKHVGGNSKKCGGKYGGDIVDTQTATPISTATKNTDLPTGTPGDSKNNAQPATPIPSPAATNNTGGRSKRQSAKSRTSTKRRLASKRSFGWM